MPMPPTLTPAPDPIAGGGLNQEDKTFEIIIGVCVVGLVGYGIYNYMTNKNKSVKTINKKEKVDIFKLIREKKRGEEKVITTNWWFW